MPTRRRVGMGARRHFADLYALSVEQLGPLERLAEKPARNVVEAIAASKDGGLSRLLAALGIRHLGGRAAEVLAAHYGDIDALAAATVEVLTEVPEIGPVIAESLWGFFASDAGQDTIARLKAAGVGMTAERAAGPHGGAMEGKTVVVTGTLAGFSRAEAEAAVKAAGGRVASSVSGKAGLVVAGANAGGKLLKARKLGVEVIDEAEFVRRLGRSHKSG